MVKREETTVPTVRTEYSFMIMVGVEDVGPTDPMVGTEVWTASSKGRSKGKDPHFRGEAKREGPAVSWLGVERDRTKVPRVR